MRVDLEVRRREPQAAAEAQPDEAGAVGEEAAPGEKPAAAPPPPAGKAEGRRSREGRDDEARDPYRRRSSQQYVDVLCPASFG